MLSATDLIAAADALGSVGSEIMRHGNVFSRDGDRDETILPGPKCRMTRVGSFGMSQRARADVGTTDRSRVSIVRRVPSTDVS
jgi:hypothetical protein